MGHRRAAFTLAGSQTRFNDRIPRVPPDLCRWGRGAFCRKSVSDYYFISWLPPSWDAPGIGIPVGNARYVAVAGCIRLYSVVAGCTQLYSVVARGVVGRRRSRASSWSSPMDRRRGGGSVPRSSAVLPCLLSGGESTVGTEGVVVAVCRPPKAGVTPIRWRDMILRTDPRSGFAAAHSSSPSSAIHRKDPPTSRTVTRPASRCFERL